MHFGLFLENDDPILHAHKCDGCGVVGTHKHGPLKMWTMLTMVNLCPNCMNAKIKGVYTAEEKKILIHPTPDQKGVADRTRVFDRYVKECESGEEVILLEELVPFMPGFRNKSAQSLALEGVDLKTMLNARGQYAIVRSALEPYSGPTTLAQGADVSQWARIRRREHGPVVQEVNVVDGKVTGTGAQMADDNASMDIAIRTLKNTYLISAIYPTGEVFTVRGVFIKGRVMLTVLHIKRHMKPGCKLHVRNVQIKDGWMIPCEDLKTIEVCGPDAEFLDQLLIEFPTSVMEHTDLTNLITDSATMSQFNTVRAGLCVAVDKNTAVIRTGDVVAQDELVYNCPGPNGPVVLKLRKAYEYNGLQNNDGDCGSPLVIMNSKFVKKIAGIHVAGSYGVGYSTALNVDNIRNAMSRLCPRAQLSFEPHTTIEYDELLESPLTPPGNFHVLGKAKKYTSAPVVTKLRHSPVYGLISKPSCAAAKLGPFKGPDGEVVNPMSKSLAKAGTTTPHLDERVLAMATGATSVAVNSFDSEEYRRVLTDQEMIEGAGEHFAPVCRKTSPGYPWVLHARGTPGKTKWLGRDAYEYHPDLKAAVEERLALAKQGIRKAAVWVDTLKDEKRPLEKVREGKTRTISAGPMDFLLLFRKYFGGFTAHVVKHRVHNEIAVGIDMHSPAEVKMLRDYVTSKGKNMIAGDFSNFDGTLCPQVLYAALEVIENFYQGSEEDRLVRRVLFSEVACSVHMRDGLLYLWTHSQPSGNPLTSYVNSLYNSISMRYVWYHLAPEGLRNMRSFAENVSLVSYGDDNLLGVSDRTDWFNQVAITDGYKLLNMVYTMESKTGEVIPFRTINEVSFLKRSFRRDEDLTWVAPLDLLVILEMGQWVHGDIDQRALCMSNVREALKELTLHGREVYEENAPKFRNACKAANLPVYVGDYDEAVDEWKAQVGLVKDLAIGAGVYHRVMPAAKPDSKPDFGLSGEPF